MFEPVVVFGAGGHARAVLDLLRQCGFAVSQLWDIHAKPGEAIFGVPVFATKSHAQAAVIVGLGDLGSRFQCYLQNQPFILEENLIHPTAVISEFARSGASNQIFAGCFIGPEAVLGKHNIINTRAVIEHQATLGNHCHIAVGAVLLGKTKVGDHCFIGAGAVVRDGVQICDQVIVGANSYVAANITQPGTYVGSPARKIK